jgi:sodium/bile acid cotransporter 7
MASMALSFGVVVVFLAVVMCSTSLTARLSGMGRADEIVLFFCGSKKSLASGLPMATAIFPAATLGATVLPLMMYHMLQLLVCSVIAQKLARRVARAG